MRGQQFLSRLREEVLLGDGALGTMFRERGIGQETNFERLNRSHPDLVRSLHQDYLDAGAQVLETNTFGANRTKLSTTRSEREVVELNRAGVELARAVAGDRAYVAGAVGPLAEFSGLQESSLLAEDQIRELFREQIVALADAGADLLLLETFSDLEQLRLALEVARSSTDLPVVCQLAFHERGHTQAGVHVMNALSFVSEVGADMVGANCGRGVRCVAAAVECLTRHSDMLVSAYPNAGLPEYVDGRYLFGAPMPYLIDSANAMRDAGANLIGGCCGTTPEYIQRLKERLADRKPATRVPVNPESACEVPTLASGATLEPGSTLPPPGSLLYKLDPIDAAAGRNDHLQPRRPLVVVELDPPRGLKYEPVVRRAQQLRDMGVDAITMADNPVATLHMGNLTLADIVQREADLPVILHLTCRDSNLIGLQSRLLEGHVRGIRHVLALTGDPARVGDMPGATSVYDMNSFGLIELITKFNAGLNNAGIPLGGRTQFTIAVAFNPNGRNLHALVDRLRRKVAKGAHFAMTQPMYDLDRFAEVHTATREINVPIFTGVMPLVSERNAEFLHNEVPGIVLTDEARQRMKGLSGKTGRAEGCKLCHELLDGMLPKADAFYLIPPPRFTEMAVDLVAHIKSRVARAAGQADGEFPRAKG